MGVELTHPDLVGNLILGYDAVDANVGGTNGSNMTGNYHGTSCAGIIGAMDNSIGVKGIANKSKIIPIRIGYNSGQTAMMTTFSSWIIDGINQAWSNLGADVLSCSWSGGFNSGIVSEIFYATDCGRNGKGCVVVFSAGNGNQDGVSFPSNLYNVISVGAISKCGERVTPDSCQYNHS